MRAIVGCSIAFTLPRTHTCKATEPTSGVLSGRSICRSVSRICRSGTIARNGDCESCTFSAWLSVSSKTCSPVVFVNAATTIESRSVRGVAAFTRMTAAIATAVTSTSATTAAARPRHGRRGISAMGSIGSGRMSAGAVIDRRSAAISSADWYRSCGRLASAFMMMASSAPGISGFNERGGAGSRFRTWSQTIATLSPLNAR